MNKKTAVYSALGAMIVILALLGYFNRGFLRELVYELRQPEVPAAVRFSDLEKTEPETSESEAKDVEAPEPADATEVSELQESPSDEVDLPDEIHLDVPFLLQAPKQNWVQPFADACEEASLLMVHAYYNDKGADFTEDEGIEAILGVTNYEDETYGHNKDTDTEEVGETAEQYFGYETALIRDVTSPRDIKEVLAQGYPVIVPAYGKALQNPNFRNGGPDYHMLVIKGYTDDGYWITNDPGTRRGKGYLYREDVLINALHEFHPDDMTLGAKRMILLIP